MAETFLEKLVKRIPAGTIISLIGPPGSGKTQIANQITYDNLIRKNRILIVAIGYPPSHIIEQLKKMGISNAEEKIVILDGYSWLLGSREDNIVDPENLTNLSIRVGEIIDGIGRGFGFIFNSISTLLNYNDEPTVLRFLQTLIARLRDRVSMAIIICHSGIHTSNFYNSLMSMTDSVINTKIEDIKGVLWKAFRIYIFPEPFDSKWCFFELDERNHITLLPKPPYAEKVETHTLNNDLKV